MHSKYFNISLAIFLLCCHISGNASIPTSRIHIERGGYQLEYDQRTKNAIWVYEKITKAHVNGNADREKCSFKEDPNISKIFRCTLADYKGVDFDRGHLAPAANHTCSKEELDGTFFFSNISPQHKKLNRGKWKSLEKHVRNLVEKHDSIEVYTGPLFLPYNKGGERLVTYKVIGPNDVAVPTHFFKIIILDNNQSEAYILPNEAIPAHVSLDTFKTTIDKVERLAGIHFGRS